MSNICTFILLMLVRYRKRNTILLVVFLIADSTYYNFIFVILVVVSFIFNDLKR